MKSLGSTFTMDYAAAVMSLVLGIICLPQVTEAQTPFPIPCPPAFPDFEAIFARTLRLNHQLRSAKFHLQSQINRPPNCSCSPALMSNIPQLNRQRCSRTSAIARVCPTTSTSRATSPTTRAPERTSSSQPIPPSPTTLGYSTGDHWSGPTPPTIDKHRTTSIGTNVNVIDLGSTTQQSKSTEPGLPVEPTPKSVTTQDDGFTIIVIAIGAGVLLLIFLIGCLLLCRKRLCVGSGARGAHRKPEKVRRLRSDCQPISAISRADTFEDSYAPSMEDDEPRLALRISSVGSVGSEGFRRSYVTNGRKWRPEFDSETGSEKSTADSKYILLREDSSASALSFSNHYNTLRTIEHPHALMMGGFGESSTDNMTIPRTSKKKRFANGDISLDSIEDPMEVMPNSSTMRRKQSKDSLNSIEIYDRVTNPARARSLAAINGYTNDHGPMQAPVQNGRREQESDNCSLDTIDQADEGLEAQAVAMTTPQQQQQPPAPVRMGIINLSFQPEEQSEKPDPDWQNNVLAELKRESQNSPSVVDNKPQPENYDSLLSVRNAHLFGYENNITDSRESQIDPPSDFRDSKDSEISVAVVQPLKQENPRFSRNFSKRKSDLPQASTSTSPAKGAPPPIAKKPQNGSVKNGLTRQASSDPIANGTANGIGGKDIFRMEADSSEPIGNGVLTNGHVPMVNGVGAQGSDEEDDVGKVKRLIRQRESGLKPSAHVQPTRYGDTRL